MSSTKSTMSDEMPADDVLQDALWAASARLPMSLPLEETSTVPDDATLRAFLRSHIPVKPLPRPLPEPRAKVAPESSVASSNTVQATAVPPDGAAPETSESVQVKPLPRPLPQRRATVAPESCVASSNTVEATAVPSDGGAPATSASVQDWGTAESADAYLERKLPELTSMLREALGSQAATSSAIFSSRTGVLRNAGVVTTETEWLHVPADEAPEPHPAQRKKQRCEEPGYDREEWYETGWFDSRREYERVVYDVKRQPSQAAMEKRQDWWRKRQAAKGGKKKAA